MMEYDPLAPFCIALMKRKYEKLLEGVRKMPHEEQGGAEMELRVPVASERITRTRFLELAQIANDLLSWLEEEKGVKPEELCFIRRMAEQMQALKRGE